MASASATIPVGYKQTEVGVIPEDWLVRELFTLGSSDRPTVKAGPFGSSLTKDQYVSEGYKIYGQEQVIRGDSSFGDYFITKEHYNELKSNSVEPGDVLISLVGTFGNVLVIPNGAQEGIINPRLVRLSFDKMVIAPKFFEYFFTSKMNQAQLNRRVQGGTMGVLNSGMLRLLYIPLPTIFEQNRIIEALSDVDNLIYSINNLLSKKRDIKQGTMQELLTRKTRLPGFSGKWKVKSLGQIGEITGAGVDKKIVEGETPVRLVNYLDVYNRSFIYSNELEHHVTAPISKATKCSVRKGDVFFTPTSEVRDDIAVSAIAMEDIPDATYSYHVVRLRIHDDWDLNFRAYAFQTKTFLDQAAVLSDGSGTRYVISLPNFRKLKVLVPTKPEQQAIGQILSDMDAEIAALEQRLEKTKAIKQGMMQQLLTGRIRLVDPSTPVEASA